MISAAEFSRDGGQLAINTSDLQKKAATVVITDSTGKEIEFLPTGCKTRFRDLEANYQQFPAALWDEGDA